MRWRLAWGERLAVVFTGISLGSVLLLVALGLAITYGLMGVINMAHGELMMIGAYTTYVVQNLFRAYLPGVFDAYVLAAIPAAFLVSALVGAVLERGVIRFLYGRPLETLLATWGISLVLQQAVRSIFGAQNVPVENPSWLSGGVEMMSNLVLPFNRIAIIAFALPRAGRRRAADREDAPRPLHARRHAEPAHGRRASASTPRAIDMLAFSFGAGIAGLGGVALSQIGNVGPDLGQSYIVDSFLVVVARRRRPARRDRRRGARPRRAQQAARRRRGRGAREDRGAGLHRHLHPEEAVGAVRDEGPERGGMSASFVLLLTA